jgi:hypothetical protein
MTSSGIFRSTRSAAPQGQSTGRMKTRPMQAEDADRRATAGRHDRPFPARRRVRRKVGRLHDVRLPLEGSLDLLAAVDVVAQRDAVDPRLEQRAVNDWG